MPGSYGILTAISPEWFTEYKILYDSIRKLSDISIAVMGLELPKEQKDYIAKQKHTIQIHYKIDEYNRLKQMGPRWRQWCKPEYMLQSPFDNTLWIDADAVVVRDFDEIFEKINQGLFFTRDHFAPITCLNDKELYEQHPVPESEEHDQIAINSGVFGYSKERDNYILEAWHKNVEIVKNNPGLKNYIRLYDQGVLIWTLRQLELIENVNSDYRFNCPAKRNVYEYHMPSHNPDGADYKWYGEEEGMGGDLIDNIKYDNPNAVIVHFAGIPKLSNLLEINNQHVLRHKKIIETRPNGNGVGAKTERVFCVGLERCGTHTIAEAIRKSCDDPNTHGMAKRPISWVRHESRPALAYEAFLKYTGQDYKTEDFIQKFEKYSRDDCSLVYESNHRLSFFIDDLNEAFPDCKFIIMIRNPVKLIRSRLFNFILWAKKFETLPGCYQLDLYQLGPKNIRGSKTQSMHRIIPKESTHYDLIDLHIWEIKETINTIVSNLKNIEESRYKIWDINKINFADIPKFINPAKGILLNPGKCVEAGQRKYGKKLNFCSENTTNWIEDLIKENTIKIYKETRECFAKLGMNFCDELTII